MAGRGNSKAQRLVSPGPTTPLLLPQAPPSPWMASEAEAPSPHSEETIPGPCSPGGRQAQTGPQAERGAPSQEDKGFPVRHGTRAAVPAQLGVLHRRRQGEAPGGGPRQTIACLPRRGAPWAAQPAERKRGALTSIPTLQRRRSCPDLRTAREGRGRAHAQAQLAPQPRAGGGGGGGWRQAGFHAVNYSVVNSAPRRGGGRESESEPSHSGAGTALSEEAGALAAVLSGAKGPAGDRAQWRGVGWGGGHHVDASTGQRHPPLTHFPLQVQATRGAAPRRGGGQVSPGGQHVQAAAHGPAGKLCGSQTPPVPLELQD